LLPNDTEPERTLLVERDGREAGIFKLDGRHGAYENAAGWTCLYRLHRRPL
jgi:hypothetical protein